MIFETPHLNDYEKQVVDDIHATRDNLRYAITSLPRWNGLLRRTTFARALRGSNSIEGINVTVEDAMAAVDGEAPLDAQSEVWAAIMGYRGAMTYVLQLSNDPHFSYGEGFIRSLHFMMLSHDLSKHPGKWRPGPIYVRDERTGQRVYEGPDAELVPSLITELIHRMNKEGGSEIVRAAMSHLNLVMIHPFSDGNGRMARCLQTLVMAREGIVEPWFCSIEEYLGRNTQPYYDVLAHVGQGKWSPGNDARPWLHFCLTAHYRQAKTLLRRSKEMRSIWDELEQEIKRRGLPERVQFALSDATLGYKVRNAGYRSAAEISDNLASRDLKLLVDEGLLIPSGENKARVYSGSSVLRVIRDKCREPRSEDDPVFGTTAYLPGFEPYKL
jgi:Fic family protein